MPVLRCGGKLLPYRFTYLLWLEFMMPHPVVPEQHRLPGRSGMRASPP